MPKRSNPQYSEIDLVNVAEIDRPLPVKGSQQDRISLNPIPKVTKSQIFVRAVLVIVVVDDGHTDPGQT